MKDLYQLYLQYPNVCIDTRTIRQNSLFFCLKGANFDGNKFALAALEKGAAYVVTEDVDLRNHPRCVVVDDVLNTLQQLALTHRKHLSIPVIAITGTNGKTTTKELIVTVLSKKFRVAYTKGNLNNHIGVPITLLSIQSTDEIAVVEMGANHIGEIDELCRLALPTYGIITNIGKAHIEGFGSFENIVSTKTALYNAVINNQGAIFVNGDDTVLQSKLNYSNLHFYSVDADKGITGKVLHNDPFLSLQVFDKTVQTHLTGVYNIYNILAAATIGDFFAVSHENIVSALSEYVPSNNRSQIIYKGDVIIIADYYNANPSSMKVALENLAQMNHPDKMAVLGDMLELGSVSHAEHQQVIDQCQQLKITAFFIGKEFCSLLSSSSNAFHDIDEFNNYLKNHPIHNTLLLVKGSHGIHLDQLSLLK